MELQFDIQPLDISAMDAARERQAQLAKPREAWDGWRSCPFSLRASRAESITALKRSICWSSQPTTVWWPRAYPLRPRA